jgi:hypothetical protein
MTEHRADDDRVSTSTDPDRIDVPGALKELAELRDKGVITAEEFELKKAEWLRKYGDAS